MVDGRITAENFLLATPQDGCTVLLMQSYPNTDNSSRPGTLDNRFSRLRINLSDIAPETVKPDAYGNVQLQSTDPSGKIVEVKSLVGGGEIEGLLETAFIVFDSIESSQRFASAIKHAVILCGGVKGPVSSYLRTGPECGEAGASNTRRAFMQAGAICAALRESRKKHTPSGQNMPPSTPKYVGWQVFWSPSPVTCG